MKESKIHQIKNNKNLKLNYNQNIINDNDKEYNNNFNPNVDFNNNLYSELNKIKLLNKKIISQQSEIEYLKSNLNNYSKTMNELIKLKSEVKRLEEELINKNNIILEFQKISQMTKDKFEIYLNKNNLQKKDFEHKLENYKSVQIENNDLKKTLTTLKNENNELKKKLKEIEFKNKTEIDVIQNDINSLKKDYENTLKQNNYIINENNKKIKENEELRKKLSLQDKYKDESNDLKNKNIILEKKLKEKDNNIIELRKIKEDLEHKLYNSNDNYNKVLIEQNNLKNKLRTLESLGNHYRNINFKYKNYKSTIPKEINSIKPRSYFSHSNNRKLLQNNDFLNGPVNDNLSMNYHSKYNLINNKRINNSNRYNRDNYLKNRYKVYTNNTSQKLEKSFDFSNYLLDNLKNKISRINFH